MRTSGVLMPISSLPSQYGYWNYGKGGRDVLSISLRREVRHTGRFFQSVLPAMEILHTSHFQASQAILILSIWSFYARTSF